MNQLIQLARHQAIAGALTTPGVVAIVDDDPYISCALGMWLELHGLRATHHASGESLLQVIHQEHDCLTVHIAVGNPVELPLIGAILDLNLPGVTGIELAHTLRGLAPKLPITIITALRDDERARYGNLPPDICCLKKPFDLDLLEDALSRLLQ